MLSLHVHVIGQKKQRKLPNVLKIFVRNNVMN